jgi:small conductance mechanosensitive channel
MRRDGADLKQLVQARARTWREMALARGLTRRAIRRARIEALVLLPLLAVVIAIYSERDRLLGPAWDTAVRLGTAFVLLALGWHFARAVGRSLTPWLFKRFEPGVAGTTGFLIRLFTMVVAIAAALRIAGFNPQTLALGGAVTAVIVGLAAQQTIGNVLAGTVLLTARPFRVGERVRLQGGPLAGAVEGVVGGLGLLYTTLASRDGPVMVPNAVALNVAVVPLTEPAGVELRARLQPNVTPEHVEQILRARVTTPMRGPPRVTLEEVDGNALVVRITAIPEHPSDGPRLAAEVLAAITAEISGSAEDAAAREHHDPTPDRS